MRDSLHRLLLAVTLVSLASPVAFAQSTTTSAISGVVVDSGGGVIPGASVVVKNNATGTTSRAVSNSTGTFSVPALEAGTYTVTVSLTGFKTAVINEVRLTIGAPINVKATLEIGALAETVEVKATSELVNTQTPTVASTLNSDQINQMPMATRNLLNAVTFLPGVNTATTNRNSNLNGLPEAFIHISLDGISNNDNFNKSTDGFFASVTPRQDAIEAVQVTTAGAGADVGGHGAVTIAFVTRSGTNRYTGSGYHYYRAPGLNTNYYFNQINNLGKNDVKLNQYGFRQGGPIVIPGVYDGRGKGFFFVNYEEVRLPNDFTRTRVVMSPEAQSGIFRYNVTVGGQTQVRSVDLFALARANGHTTTLDPTVIGVLAQIRAASLTTGVINPRTDPNTLDFVWQSPGKQNEWQPVVKIDYNLGVRHRLSGSFNQVRVVRAPDHLNGADVRFPGFPNWRLFQSTRPLTSISLRSTLSSNLVNELRGGGTFGVSYFGHDDATDGPQTFEQTGGYALTLGSNNFSIGSELSNAHTSLTPSWRGTPSFSLDDTVNWQKGRHSLTFGGSMFRGTAWEKSQQRVPSIGFGVDDLDPAAAMFTSGNFADASNAQLGNARNLYALLVGRVTSIGGQLALDENTNKYVYLGERKRAGRINEYSVFLQDSWRATRTLTLNGGLRWDVQQPFQPSNDIMSITFYEDACGVSGIGPDGVCRFFQPGPTGGIRPQFAQFKAGQPGYNTDWNNVAPNVGFAWRPNVQNGFLRTLLGDPEQATLRGGYSVAFSREGFGEFTGVYGSNPGSTISVTRSSASGNLVLPGESWPVYFSERNRLSPPAFSEDPSFPIQVRPGRLDSLNLFHPDIEVPFARSYTLSFQRALSRDMAVDIRYVGTRGRNQWDNENYNERNLIENGFFEEFKLAMANLQANQAAGRGNTFAYTGAPGTSPLPTYLAYFNGRSDAGNTVAYAGSNWTNSTFVGRLARHNPSPSNAASDLDGDATRRASALAAGLAANFFVLNPDVSSVNVTTSNEYSTYDALQIELRRRLSQGFQINGSYQYALESGSSFLGRRYGRVLNPSANVRHAFKVQWDWSVPVGRGRRFGTDMNPVLDYILGGWEFNGVGRVQARVLNFGNVRLIGMTAEELGREYFYRYNSDTKIVTILPDDIILNTRRAFNVSATTATGYSGLGVPEGRHIAPANSETCIQLKSGDCAPRTLLVQAPFYTRFDMSVGKKIQTGSRVSFELRFDVLNVFDNINFDPAANPGTGSTIFQVTSAYRDPSNTFDPGGRLGQIVWRVNW